MRTFYKFYTFGSDYPGYRQEVWTFPTLKEATEQLMEFVACDDRLSGERIYKFRRPDTKKDADELGFFLTCDEEDEDLWDIIETITAVRTVKIGGNSGNGHDAIYQNIDEQEGMWQFISNLYEERKNARKD